MKTTIDIAREVDPVTKLLLDKKLPQGMDHDVFMWFLERFEALVRADERAQCALVAEDSDHVVGGRGYYDQLGDADATVRNIAAAIRNRGNT
jgi:hypothetical protein